MTTRKMMIAAAAGLTIILASLASAQFTGTEDIYISASGSGTAGTVSFADEDIVLCDRSGGTCVWSMFFDGSVEGVSKSSDLTAFHVQDDDNILLAFKTPKRLGKLKKVDDSDIVHFDRDANTNNRYTFFFDGSDVGLTTDDESIDAMGFTPGGDLLISTDGDYSVPKTGGGTLAGGDEDMLIFHGTTGPSTSGNFELYLDGSAFGLNSPQEDIWGAWVDDNTDEVYLTTRGAFSVGSLTGTGTDIFICNPANFDPISACATVNEFFVAEDEGFDDKIIDGIFIVNNTPPVAQDDNFTTDEDTALAGASNVMDDNDNGADFDVDGDPLTVTEVNGSAANVGILFALASGALLTVNADGSMSYDPNGQFESLGAGETFDDTFGYTIDDGNGGTDSATVTITVTGVNDAPVLDPVGNKTVDELTELSFTATASDVESDMLTFSLSGTVPAGAGITAGGDFTWTPSEAQGPGIYTFDVVVTDDGAPTLSDSETITVTVDEVNVAPVLDEIGNQTIDELSLLNFTATATDADLPPNTLTFSLAGAVPAGASITAGGLFTWTPTEAQGPGPYTFDVVVTDDGVPIGDDSETITVTVNEVNLAPVLDPVGDQTIDEETLLSFTATATDADLPPNTLTFSLAGTVPAGASITAGGDFSWMPTEEQGPDTYTFDVVVTDDGTPNLDDSETITVTVEDVNNAPVLDAIGNQNIDEETLLNFTATATDADLPPDTLTFSLAGAVPAGASITAGGDFTWTPTEAQGPGPYTFDVVVTDDGTPNLDDSETITVTVNEVNVAPVLDPVGNQSIDEGSLLSFTATATDADLPPNTLTFSLAGTVPAGAGITAGGLFSWTPTEAQGPGPYSFDVVVTDDGAPNLSDSENITVTVNEVNVAPVLDPIGNPAIDELSLLSFTATATDADIPANGLTFSLAGTVPAGAGITTGGLFTWTPTETQGAGPYTFDVVVTDDGAPNLADSETITVTVNEINLAPVLDPVGNQDIDEGSLLSFTATATDADLPPNALTFSLAGTVPAGAGITAGGLFTWTPSEAQGPDTYTFDVVVTDDGVPNLADSENIMVTVNEVPDPPVVTAPGPFDVTGNVKIQVPDGGDDLLSNVVGDTPLTITDATATSANSGVVNVSINQTTGAFSYNPPVGYEGSDSFNYEVCNVNGCDTATVNLTVADMIWFIDNGAGAAGDGRLNTPFDDLAAFESVNGNGGANDPEAGDDVFVYTGAGSYSGGVTLENNQQLIGQGTTDTSLAVALGITLAPNSDPLPSINGTRPVLGPTGTAVVLASGDTVRGLDISVTGASQGLVGTGFGSATIDEMAITTVTGTALNLNNGNASATFDSITSTGAGGNSAIVLNDTGADAITVNGGTIANKSTDAITFNDTDGPITLANMIIEDIGDASDLSDALNTRSQQDGIHGQAVSGGLTLDGVTIRRISDNCVNGALFADGVSATTWNGLEIFDSLIENCNRYHVTDKGDSSDEGGVRIAGIHGTVMVVDSVLQFAADLLDLTTHVSGSLDMTVQSSTFNRSIKEFPTGGTVNTGLHGIDVTFKGDLDGVIRIGDPAEISAALGNTFTDNAVGSIRIAQDAGTTGDVATVISLNTFEILDHLTSQQSPGNFVFNFAQGGVLLWARGGTFEAIVSKNLFNQVMHADGGLGQLTLIGDTGSDSEFIVEGNTFDLPWDAPVRVLADANNSMAVRFGGILAGEPNTYIDGLLPSNLADDLGDGCTEGYLSPYTPWHLNVRNGGALDLTIQDEFLPQHDDGSSPCFPGGSGFARSFDASMNSGASGTLNLGITGSASPDGYNLAQGGGSGVFNLYATAGCGGAPTPQAILLANSNTGGGGTYLVNGDATSPPVVGTSGTISCTTTAPTLPSITIP